MSGVQTPRSEADWHARGAPILERPSGGIPGQNISELPVLDKESGGRLIVVSNRIPVSVSRNSNGTYNFKPSSGGLVSALAGCKSQLDFLWIGWPGLDIPESEREGFSKQLTEEYSCSPVFLSDDIADRYYNGFSNSILWPLFHYHNSEQNFDETEWSAYKEANSQFAEAIYKAANPGDIIWVQDYHLMCLPQMLRKAFEGKSVSLVGSTEDQMRSFKDFRSRNAPNSPSATLNGGFVWRNPSRSKRTSTDSSRNSSSAAVQRQPKKNITIGFFLHTPFPSSEVFRTLPVRKEILLGILHCDLIGFHTYDYARHFLSSCTRVLGLTTLPNGVEFGGRYARVGTFPIGIDPRQFTDTLRTEATQNRIKQLEQRFKDVKVIVGVDRLDYIKGIPQKLQALEVFLEEHPEWIGKVVLVQVAVPSRQDVEEYQNLRMAVNELVGRINGRFGTVEFMPIHFMHRSVTFQELCALYALGEACFVTSTRDGMNLVSYEYIACQEERQGSMILSEFAGAAHSLNGSIIFNPWNIEEAANGIHAAMTMDPKTRSENYGKLSTYVNKYTSVFWGLSFVAEMQKISKLHETKGGPN